MNDRTLWFVGAALFLVAAIAAAISGEILLAAGMALLAGALAVFASREPGAPGTEKPMRGAPGER